MVYDEFWLQEHPYWSYDDAHATIDDEFPYAWATHWGIRSSTAPDHVDPDFWEEVQQLYGLAQRLVRAAVKLSGARLPESTRTLPSALAMEAEAERRKARELLQSLREQARPEVLNSPGWRMVERLLKEGGDAGRKERLFRTAVQIHAWPVFGTSPGLLARRCLELLDHLVRCKGLRAREYLSRVAACYVRGMRPEMAVMSRAVLEAALEDLDLEERVASIREVKGKRYDSLTDWIDAASAAGAIDEEGRLAAETVRDAGDTAAHKAPGLVPPEAEVLQALKTVLEQVEGFGRAA